MPPQQDKAGFTPPYISFRTLQNFLAKTDSTRLPPQIDRTYISWLAGSQQTQLLGALKQLGLTGEKGEVKDDLVKLVAAKDPERRTLMRTVIERHYSWVAPLNAKNATQGQLDAEFRKHNVDGQTLRKSIAFYLQAASYAGITVSPNFKGRGRESGGSSAPRAARKPRPRGKQDLKVNPPSPPPPADSQHDPALASRPLVAAVLRQLPQDNKWNQGDHDRWVDLFMKALDWDVKVGSVK